MAGELDHLLETLKRGSAAERSEAAQRLAGLGPEAQPAAVPLVEACGTEDESLREWVTAALEELGPPPEAAVPRLAQLLADENLDTAYWAATLLGRLEEQAAPAVPQLAQALGEHHELAVRERAAWALGKIGSAAAAARHPLEAAAGGSERRLATLAGRALTQLDG
ncbi:MAG: hypothetical protein DWQ37_14970 [Planctomycetota bacterium]|nr:MAG: hypothetical protein DWQ37_14970 [Planctomycetota bacterium]